MIDQVLVYAIGAVIGGLVLSQAFRRTFDPFAPIWLFLVGFTQIYVVQAITCREYALRARGIDLVTQANGRALWALLWFLLVYYFGPGRAIAAKLPRPPARWSIAAVATLSPLMIAWGLICSLPALIDSGTEGPPTPEAQILRSFPMMMLVAGVLLIVTGRRPDAPRPAFTWAGVAVSAAYVLIWTFNGKRSHALIGVLTGVCAYYIARGRRPSKAVLAATAFAGVLVVSLAIGWRGNVNYDRSASGFLAFLADFRLEALLVNLNVQGGDPADPEADEPASHETLEYGGFLLMMDTVPGKAGFDRGSSYIRLVSTFIPRVVWPGKPYYGRAEWVAAWMAGSEFPRDESFTGPAIGVLGAAQLNGGAIATAILLAALAMILRTSYEFFRRYAGVPWAQAWWAVTYYNAWLMTVNDDPFVWFYYLYGFTTLPPLLGLWAFLKLSGRGEAGPVAESAGRPAVLLAAR